MATIFGNLSGYTLTGSGTAASLTTVPTGKAWACFYQGPSSPPGMTALGTSGNTFSVWAGLFTAGSTTPGAISVFYFEFSVIASINTL